MHVRFYSSKTGYTLGIAPRYHVYTAGDDDHEASGFLAWDGGEEIKGQFPDKVNV